MKRGKNRLIAGIGTVWFMSLISTSAAPKMWQVALIAIGFYEIASWTVCIARREARKSRRRKYITATKIDMKRVEDQVFNPLRSMREVS